MKPYELLILIIGLATLFAYVNARFLRLQQTIGIMLLSFLFSGALVLLSATVPSLTLGLIKALSSIPFHDYLMDGMLSFLLFAGAMHIHTDQLQKARLPIIAFSTLGILISTLLIGSLFYGICLWLQHPIDLLYCFVFAALISPTDPIAVLSILKSAGLPKSLETKIAGESLFNDGVAVVVFITLLEIAQTGLSQLSLTDVAILLLQEAGGGLLFGYLLGYAGYFLIKKIDQYEVEVMLTVALAMCGYAIANSLHCSGPLAMVVAGLIVGNKAHTQAVSATTRAYLFKFWELMDAMLNAVLFMLIGFEMLVVKVSTTVLIISLGGIIITLLARWISIYLPYIFLKKRIQFMPHAVAILTWGGLRGGLSIALALSLPKTMHHDTFVTITYIIVLFSIIGQGLTIGPLYKRLMRG